MKLASLWRLLLLSLLLWLLYQQLWLNEQFNLGTWLSAVRNEWGLEKIPYALLLLLLIPLNWGLEALKWQWLCGEFERPPLAKAFRAVLAGLTVSLFTPNRIGEYGGRVLFVGEGQGWKAVWASLLSSWSQWSALLLGGLVAWFAWLGLYAPPIEPFWVWMLSLLGLALALVFVLLPFSVRHWQPWLYRKTGWAWLQELFACSAKTCLAVWLASLLRYGVYSLQFWACLHCFELPFAPAVYWMGIGLIFLLQTGLPLPPATGLVARGNIALWVFGQLWPGAEAWGLSILASTFGLWLFNVFVPALLGAFFLWQQAQWAWLGWRRAKV